MNSCGDRCCGHRRGRGAQVLDVQTAFLPNRKNVARTHSFLRASKTREVVPGHGPSSKVSTSSLSCSGKVEGNCLRPMRGSVLTSTWISRAVPSACGLPGQGSAMARRGREGNDEGEGEIAGHKSVPVRELIASSAVRLPVVHPIC